MRTRNGTAKATAINVPADQHFTAYLYAGRCRPKSLVKVSRVNHHVM